MNDNKYEDLFHRIKEIVKSECFTGWQWDVYRYPGCRVKVEDLNTKQWIMFGVRDGSLTDEDIKERMNYINQKPEEEESEDE